MSSAFNLTAQINLRGPANIRTVVADIRRQLGTVTVDINPQINANAARNITQLSVNLRNLNATLDATVISARNASRAITNLGTAINNIGGRNVQQNMAAVTATTQNLTRNLTSVNRGAQLASTQMEEFGRQSALAIRRFAAFSIVTSAVYSFINALSKGVDEFIKFDKEFVRLQQVTGESAKGLQSLASEISRLSTQYGVASNALTQVSVTLAQAGLTAGDTKRALEALAQSALSPSFDDMNETVEGSIALMRQFGISATDLGKSLGSVSAVSAQFAVEASDIITAIQRTGGVFATASKGVSQGADALNEFIALFTSVRQTTRESAETIATGLRTIFTRIQRGGTIDALKEFGVTLTDLEGKFVGPFEAIKRLSIGLKELDPRDLRFSAIVEELGGFRQIGKVIPLIQQFTVAQQALKVAQQGQDILAKDAATAQLSLANQIAKVREEFLALVRSIGESDSFRSFVGLSLQLASALIRVADAAKDVLPAIAAISTIKGISALTQFGAGFTRGLTRPRGFATGGYVPGSGNRDTVPAMLTPGEFVIRKKAVETIGADKLHAMNKYAGGGSVQKFAGGRLVMPKGRGTSGARGSRSRFKDLTEEELAQLSTDDLIKYAKAQARDIFSAGGAGIATSSKFIPVPKDRITPELESSLTTYLGQKGFWKEIVSPFGKPNKMAAKAQGKLSREEALKKQQSRLSDEVAARAQQWTSIRSGSSIDNYLLSSLQEPILSDYRTVRGGGSLSKPFYNTRLRQSVNKALENYDDFDYSSANIDKLVSNFAAKKFASGGLVQKFTNAGKVRSPKIGSDISQLITRYAYSPEMMASKNIQEALLGLVSKKKRGAIGNSEIASTIAARIKDQSITPNLVSEILGSRVRKLGQTTDKLEIQGLSLRGPTPKEENVSKTISGKQVSITRKVVSQSIADKFEKIANAKIQSLISELSGLLDAEMKAAGIKSSIGNKAQRDAMLKSAMSTNVGNLMGDLFERTLIASGATVGPTGKGERRPIDLASLGPVGELFGLDPTKPTEIKRSMAKLGLGKKGLRGQISRYIKMEGLAQGGSIQDTVPALLTPGEFVINKKAASRIGASRLHNLNRADKIQGFNKGGAVGHVQKFASGRTVNPGDFEARVQRILMMLEQFEKNIYEGSRTAGQTASKAKEAARIAASYRLSSLEDSAESREARLRYAQRGLPQQTTFRDRALGGLGGVIQGIGGSALSMMGLGRFSTAGRRAAAVTASGGMAEGAGAAMGGGMGGMGGMLPYMLPVVGGLAVDSLSQRYGGETTEAGRNISNIGSSVLNYGSTGAMLGSILGPWGTAAGAAAGAAYGLYEGLNKAKEASLEYSEKIQAGNVERVVSENSAAIGSFASDPTLKNRAAALKALEKISAEEDKINVVRSKTDTNSSFAQRVTASQQSGANAAVQFLNAEIVRTGKTYGELASSLDPSIVKNIIEADQTYFKTRAEFNQRIEEQKEAGFPASSIAALEKEKNAALSALTKEIINRVTAESRAAIEAEKTAKQQAMLQQAVERVMQTYADSFNAFDQILSSSSASIDQINQRLSKIASGLTGFSATAGLEENLNILRNPKAFSEEQRNTAFTSASSSFPGMEKTFKQITDYSINAEKAVRENLKKIDVSRISGGEGALEEEQINIIQDTFNKQINEVFKGDETLKRAVDSILKDAREDAKKGFLDIDKVIKQIVESTGGQLGTTVENLLIKSQEILINTFDKINASAQQIAQINQNIIDRNANFTSQTISNRMAYSEALGQQISPSERLRLNLAPSAQRLGINLAPGQTLNANMIASRRSELEQQRTAKEQELARLMPEFDKNKEAISELSKELAKLDISIGVTTDELEKFGSIIQSAIDENIRKIADRAKVLEEDIAFRREDYISQLTSTPEQRINNATIQRLTQDAISGRYSINNSPGANKAYNEFMQPYRQEMAMLNSIGAIFSPQAMQEVQRVMVEGQRVAQQAFAQEIEQIINNFQRTNRDPEDPKQRAQLGQLLQNLGQAQGIDPALIKQISEEAQMNAQDRANAAKADQKIIEFTGELKKLYADQAAANEALNKESNDRIITIQKDVVAPTLEAVTKNTDLLSAEIKRLSEAVSALAAAGGKPITPTTRAHGGLIYANKGMLVNYQAKGSDTVPAMLTPGEFVVNKDATQKNLGLLKAINGGATPYSKGGIVYAVDGGQIIAAYNQAVAEWEAQWNDPSIPPGPRRKELWANKPGEFSAWLNKQPYSSSEKDNARFVKAGRRERAIRQETQAQQQAAQKQKDYDASIRQEVIDTQNEYEQLKAQDDNGTLRPQDSRRYARLALIRGVTPGNIGGGGVAFAERQLREERLLQREGVSEGELPSVVAKMDAQRRAEFRNNLAQERQTPFYDKVADELVNLADNSSIPGASLFARAATLLADPTNFVPAGAGFGTGKGAVSLARRIRPRSVVSRSTRSITTVPSPVLRSSNDLTAIADRNGTRVLLDAQGRTRRILSYSDRNASSVVKPVSQKPSEGILGTTRDLDNILENSPKPRSSRIDLKKGIQRDPEAFARSSNKEKGVGTDQAALPSVPKPKTRLFNFEAIDNLTGKKFQNQVYATSEAEARNIISSIDRHIKITDIKPISSPTLRDSMVAATVGLGLGAAVGANYRYPNASEPKSQQTSRQDVNVKPTSSVQSSPKPVVSDNNRSIKREGVPTVLDPLTPKETFGRYDYYATSKTNPHPPGTYAHYQWRLAYLNPNYFMYNKERAFLLQKINETASPFDPEYKPAIAMQNEKEANPMPQTAPSSRNDSASDTRKPRNAKEARQMEAERLDKAGIGSETVNLDRNAKEAMFKKHFETINKQINIPIGNRLAYLIQIANDPRFIGNLDMPKMIKEINGLNSLLISEDMLKAAYGLYRIPEIVPDIVAAQQEVTRRVTLASVLLGLSGSRREFLQTGVPVAAQNRSKGGLIYASNGMMVPYEPKGTDTVPAMLTPGEFVVNRESTKKNLGLLKAINKARGGRISMEELQMLTGSSLAGFYEISPDDEMFLDASAMRSRPWARGGEKEATDQYYYMQKLFEEYWSKPQMRRYRSTPQGQAAYDKMRKIIAYGLGLDNVGRPVFNNPWSKYGDPASHAKDLETIFGRLPSGMSYSSSTNAAGGNTLMNQWRSNGGVIYASQGQLVNYQPRGSDTVPAMLTPGEFVVNKESTQKNLGLLTAINKSRGGVIYARDGVEVGASSNSSYGSMGATTVNFSIPQDIKDQLSSLTMIKLDPAAITSLNSFKTDFSNIVQRLNSLNINIPAKIEMVGIHQVNVTIDAPALENMIPGIESMVASSVSSKMEQIWNQSGGELGPTPTMYG